MDSSPGARYPSEIRQRLVRQSHSAHHIALSTVIGEAGIASLFLMAVVAGLGLLLDFQITHLHPVFSIGLVLVSAPISFYWTIHRVHIPMKHEPNADYLRNLALATVAGQAGCMSVILIFAGLFGGMFLDSRLDTHPIFTIGLMFAAIPIGLYAMIRLMLSSVAAIKPSTAAQPPAAAQSSKKENGS